MTEKEFKAAVRGSLEPFGIKVRFVRERYNKRKCLTVHAKFKHEGKVYRDRRYVGLDLIKSERMYPWPAVPILTALQHKVAAHAYFYIYQYNKPKKPKKARKTR